MKKRWFLTSLFALCLCICAVSAQAAVVSGGTEYVWYTDMGRGYINENDQFVSNEGQQLYLSADQGGSYAVLPGLGEAQKLTGLSYAVTVEPNAANDGGLSVKARDTWSSEYTWFRDYSAQEIAAALKNAVATPVEAFATNGTVTVGTRYVTDLGNDDPTQPNYYGGNHGVGGYNGDRLVYSTDGVTWLPAEQEKGEYYSAIESGWWDGSAFHAGKYVSADGVHWTDTGEEQIDPTFALACELGPYRFEYAENDAGEWGVYLMDHDSPDTGVLLPHMGEAAKAKWVSIGKLRAWYGPNDTVILAAYDVYSRERMMVSIDYPISSLDWCLENLKTQFRSVEILASNGTVSLGMVERWSGGYERELLRCGDGWQWATPPFREIQRIYPYNGKTFVVRSDGKLYASEDGLSWECLEGRGLGDDWDWREYAFAWAGDRYISCRRTVEYSAGRAGIWGEKYDPACTQVSFLNEKFESIGSYDFGRQVKAVGYLDGIYYAQVSDSAGVSTEDYRKDAPSALYRSTDGKSWEKLPDIYVNVDDVMIATKGGSGVGNQPTNDPNKPLRMVAQLGQYRFALKEIWGSGYTVGLMMGNAQDWMELDGLREAIQSHWILPGEVTTRYTADGSVEVTVTDLSTPSMTCSVTYSAAALDESLKNGVRTEDGVWDRYHMEYPEEEQSKAEVADVAVMALPNGEREIVYRTAATGGKYLSYDSVPWSNSVVLLPFSGKDFMVLDKADGKVYLSADGVSWREATGNWIVGNRAHNYWEYAFVWTGKNYLACCYLDNGKTGDERQVSREAAKVFFLDENLNVVSSHDFGKGVEKVGFGSGAFYAEVGKKSWDERGRYGYINTSSQAPNILWRSTDGVNWETTDVIQVRDALVGLQ